MAEEPKKSWSNRFTDTMKNLIVGPQDTTMTTLKKKKKEKEKALKEASGD